jgi:hypothetical protein
MISPHEMPVSVTLLFLPLFPDIIHPHHFYQNNPQVSVKKPP